MATTHKIAVVDDDYSVRAATALMLTSRGLDVETYGSAEEVLVRCDLPSTEVLLLDLNLPGMSGLELLQLLRKRKITIPVIVRSGFLDPKTCELIWEAGSSFVIHKAVSGADLVTLIQQVLTRDQRTNPPEDHPNSRASPHLGAS